MRTRRVAIVAAVLSSTLASMSAQSRWTAPKTPWGDPDLQEIWSTEDLRDIPYERPVAYQGRALLTDEEFAKREAATNQGRTRGQAGFANGSKTRTFRQTSLIVDGDGQYPRLTPEALAHFRITDIGTYGEGPFLSAADFNLYDRCITRGVVGSLLPVAYGNGLQIFQTLSQVVINYEMVHETRVIPLDGRPALSPRIRTYMGDSRGRFEGNTLVVRTTNFNGATGAQANGNPMITSDSLEVVEKFTRTGPDTMQYEVMVNDPKTWTRPWTAAFPLKRDPGYKFFEYACHEGNHAMSNILSGSRSDEKQKN
jgi:hypothetical protein